MKNFWLIIGIIAIVVVIVLVINGNQLKQSGNITSVTQTTESVICTDSVCFQPKFLTCTPSELRMPFADSATFAVTVFGLENGKCHYTIQVINQSDTEPEGGLPPTINCYLPFEQLSNNVLMHLFGLDKEPGQENIKKEQDKLETEYCLKQ